MLYSGSAEKPTKINDANNGGEWIGGQNKRYMSKKVGLKSRTNAGRNFNTTSTPYKNKKQHNQNLPYSSHQNYHSVDKGHKVPNFLRFGETSSPGLHDFVGANRLDSSNSVDRKSSLDFLHNSTVSIDLKKGFGFAGTEKSRGYNKDIRGLQTSVSPKKSLR